MEWNYENFKKSNCFIESEFLYVKPERTSMQFSFKYFVSDAKKCVHNQTKMIEYSKHNKDIPIYGTAKERGMENVCEK